MITKTTTTITRTRQQQLYQEATSNFGDALARLASGYESDRERRRDLLQEIHMALWDSLGSYDELCSLRTWVYRVGHNVAINHVIKDKRVRQWVKADTDALEEIVDERDAISLSDEQATLDSLRKVIQALGPPDQQIMLLYLDDIDAATIAQITGLSPNGVAIRIHRAKQMLARRFHQGEPT